MKLDNLSAVVLGGARGIGKAYCVSLLEKKVKVCCADVLEDVGKETEKELKTKYGEDCIVFRTCDGGSDTQIRELLQFTKAKFGRLDIVINNVGIVDEQRWEKVVDINFGTTIRVTNATLDLLGKDKGGNGGILVHTASNGGLIPAFFSPVYCATKAAMVQYTRSWAHQVNYQHHGIRMLTMCPKMTDTDFLSQNADPNKVVKLDVLLTVFNPNDKSAMLRAEWVGEALVAAIEDDSLNGVAVQMLSREPKYWYQEHGSQVVNVDTVGKK